MQRRENVVYDILGVEKWIVLTGNETRVVKDVITAAI